MLVTAMLIAVILRAERFVALNEKTNTNVEYEIIKLGNDDLFCRIVLCVFNVNNDYYFAPV